MAYFLFASAIVASFSSLALLYRLNRQLASWPVAKNAFLPDKILPLMNTGGKWLTLAGGAATLPSVLTLLFFPAADQVMGLSVHPIILLGMGGMSSFLVAALLLIPAFLDCCLTRPTQAKRLLASAYRFALRKGTDLASRKVFLFWLAGAFVVIAFLPFFIELFTFTTYAFMLVVAGRLGFLDGNNGEHKGHGFFYNFATGKFDDGYSFGGRYHHYDDD